MILVLKIQNNCQPSYFLSRSFFLPTQFNVCHCSRLISWLFVSDLNQIPVPRLLMWFFHTWSTVAWSRSSLSHKKKKGETKLRTKSKYDRLLPVSLPFLMWNRSCKSALFHRIRTTWSAVDQSQHCPGGAVTEVFIGARAASFLGIGWMPQPYHSAPKLICNLHEAMKLL